ncbi:cytochrome C [bacterium]|nr:MAG: cytochrome C [bacterium]
MQRHPGGSVVAEKRKRLVLAARALVVILVIFLILQFIRPPGNQSVGESASSIQTLYPVPAEIHDLLRRSCYDCHSNRTIYPWYSYVEPVGWWLNSHITEGKSELNFDEFTSYPVFRQLRKLQAIRQQVEDGKMPLPSYTVVHTSAILTPEERGRIIHWVEAMKDTMKARYPADSLKRPARGR